MREGVVRQMASLEGSHWWFVARRMIVVELLEASVGPRSEILAVDIGCGTGGNLSALPSRYRCVGVDPSAEAIAFARMRHGAIQFRCGGAPCSLPAELSRADVILAMDVLEHIERDAEALTAIVERAPVGAVFLVTVPADGTLWSPHDVAHGHVRRYDRDSFARLWADLPVETALLSYFNTRLYPFMRAARAWSRWRRKSWGDAGTDLFMPPALFNRLLCSIFAGEGRVLVDTLEGKRPRGYSYGASLIAILRRRPAAARADGAIAAPILRSEARPCATAF